MDSPIKKFDPAVDKKVLIALSGLIWSIVGGMLCRLAIRWLSETAGQHALAMGLSGAGLAVLIHYFLFLRLLHKNINRILSKEGKVCMFAFQPWRSYLIVAIMIGMGTILRQSALPKPYLAVVYIGFGGAMILSSFVYYWNFFKYMK